MGVITSTQFSTRAGSGTIELENGTLAGGTTFEVSNVGSISAEFSLKEDTEDASAVLFNLGEYKFSAYDSLSNGDSLFETLDALSSSDIIDVRLNFTTDGGHSFIDEYVMTIENMEYDRESREVSFETEQKFQDADDKTLTDFFTNDVPGDVEDYRNQANNNTNDCVSAKDFIIGALGLLNPNITGANIINATNNFNPADDQATGVDHFVVVNWNSTQQTQVRDNMFRLAAMDGAVVGSLLGYSFMVHRKDTTSSVSLSEDEVESLKVFPGLESYFNIKCIFATRTGFSNGDVSAAVTDWASVESLAGGADGLNDNGLDLMNIWMDSRRIGVGQWDTIFGGYDGDGFDAFEITGIVVDDDEPNKEGDYVVSVDDGSGGAAPSDVSSGDFVYFNGNLGRFYEVDSLSSNELTLVDPLREDVPNNASVSKIQNTGAYDSMAQDAAEAYASAFGGNKSRRLEMTVFDIDKVMPHEAVALDSSFPALLQGQTYRASEVEYDMEGDRINFKMYRIA